MRRSIFLVLALIVTAASVLAAHDLFLKPDSHFLDPNTPVRMPVLNGTFQLSENSITPDRVSDISVVETGRRRRMDTGAWAATGDTSFLSFRTGSDGTGVAGVSTLPRELDLAAKDFNDYLEHDGVLDVLEARRRDGQLTEDARERYSKHVKAVFQVGGRRSPGFDVVLGYPAELVPLDNPYALGSDETLRVRCLVDGNPVAGQLVLWGGEDVSGSFQERSTRSDASGVAVVRIDKPGKWYVKFINMVPSDEDGLDYVSKWATLTFQVR